MAPAREPIGRIDIVIAVVASAVAILYAIGNVTDESVEASVASVPFMIGLTLPLLWRRAAPTAALAGMLGALVFHAAVFGEVIRCGLALPVMLLLVYSAGARMSRDGALLGLGLAVAISLVVCLTDGPHGAPLEALTFLVPITFAVWAAGRLVRSRGRMAAELEARTHELRAARDERSRLEVATERARLSAELDELLQRRLGALAALADAGAHPSDPEASAARLAEIERESRRTLEEMRAVVGVLRDDESDAPMAPQPTLTHLEAMLVHAKGAGARLNVEGSLRVVPAGVELSAYRIVEQLLDALADSPAVEVTVRFADDALELGVSGPPRRHSAEAVERTRERVRLHHGTLEATTDQGRAEFLVSLPLFATV